MTQLSEIHRNWLQSQCSGFLEPGEWEELLDALHATPSVSVRIHPYKFNLNKPPVNVPWCHPGFYLSRHPSFTHDPYFHTGAYYVQEASGMFVSFVTSCFLENTGSSDMVFLDACAAPGGKTTLLSDRLKNTGVLVANEVVPKRNKVLVENVLKNGNANIIITQQQVRQFEILPEYFDFILADVPCSGEGLWRKNPEAVTEWSLQAVKNCAARQREIMVSLWKSLKPGGWMVYCTCTFNRLENEDNIHWFLQHHTDAESIEFAIPVEWNIYHSHEKNFHAYRFFPHRLAGEGFFLSVLYKKETAAAKAQPGAAIPKGWKKTTVEGITGSHGLNFMTNENNVVVALNDSVLKRFTEVNALKPSSVNLEILRNAGDKSYWLPALAWRSDLGLRDVPSTVLSNEEILDYLMCDTSRFHGNPAIKEGCQLVKCHGLGLGFIRRTGNTVRIDYPQEYRIIRKATPVCVFS